MQISVDNLRLSRLELVALDCAYFEVSAVADERLNMALVLDQVKCEVEHLDKWPVGNMMQFQLCLRKVKFL
jgi:hypothetical protein